MSDFMRRTEDSREIRQPVQKRSATRMAKVLHAAERMLKEAGPEKTSIPALARAVGVPRASIYQFFPDKYALFAHLAEIHIARLAGFLVQSKDVARTRTWRTWVESVVAAAAEYYNSSPVASILLLAGSFGDNGPAHTAKNEAIGKMFRARVERFGRMKNLPTNPDVAAIAVEIAFACMKHGYSHERVVSPAICKEATRAVTAYLMQWE